MTTMTTQPRRGVPAWAVVLIAVAAMIPACGIGAAIGAAGGADDTSAPTATETVTETVTADGEAAPTVTETVTETVEAAPAADPAPAEGIGNGSHLVGEAIQPGTRYRWPVDGDSGFPLCSVVAEDATGGILDIQNAEEGELIVTIPDGATIVRVSGCLPGGPA